MLMKMEVYRGNLSEFDTLTSTEWWQPMVLEQLIALMAPYPGLQNFRYVEQNTNWNTSYSYDFNQILMCLSFTRIYLHLRFTIINSKFQNPRSKRVCQMNGCEANHMFAIKSIMKQNPYVFISVIVASTIFLFGY
jgi:hypothetical protein